MPASARDLVAPLATSSEGSGPRLVLVHGFTQTGRSWRAVQDLLVDRYEVVTVDLPGHGRSVGVVADSLEQAGELVARSGGPATYIGYSMGGRIALHAAFSDPDAVERLVLLGATPGIANKAERSARIASDSALASRLEGREGVAPSLDEFLAEWLAGPLFAHMTPEAAAMDARRENTTDGLATALRSLGTGTQHFDRERLGTLDMPVLVLAGSNDEKFTTIGRELAQSIGANARFESVEGAGHAAAFDDPARFVAIVDDWCSSTESAVN